MNVLDKLGSKDVSRRVEAELFERQKRCAMSAGAWIKEQHVRCDSGKIVEHQVNMMVTFVPDD